MKTTSKVDILAVIATCLFVLLLCFLSTTYYSDEQLDGSFSLQQGPLPYNEFYPLLHPIVVRGIGYLFGDINTGAKVLSNVMAGIFVFATYLLAAKSVNRKAGLICLLFTITNLHVIVFGILVSTDMMAAAFVSVTLVLMVQLLSKPNSKTVIGLSLTFSLAYFTRYQAMLLLPTIFICVFLSFKTSAKKCCLNVVIFVMATLIFLTPHFCLTMKGFGRPIYDRNWKNVAAKLYYDKSKRHESYLDKIPFNGLVETIMHSPSTFIKSGLHELVLFVRFGASNILGLPPILGGLFFTGLFFMLFSLSRTRLTLLSFLAVFVIVISFTFFSTHARVMFPIFPICYLAIVEFLLPLDSKIITFKKYTIRPVTIFAILLCVAKGVSILPDLMNFLTEISGSG